MAKMALHLELRYRLESGPCSYLSGALPEMIHSDRSLAIPKTTHVLDVTTFLPVDKTLDSIMRITIVYDVSVFKTLCDEVTERTIGTSRQSQLKYKLLTDWNLELFEPERTVKSAIGVYLGPFVLDAVSTSCAWRKELETTNLPTTACIEAQIYPGSFCVLSLPMEWQKCFRIVKELYKL